MNRFLFFIVIITISCNNKRGSHLLSNEEKVYFSTGSLKSTKKYDKGKISWKVTDYFENGRISSVATYYKGKFFGEVTFFYPNGQRNFVQNYDSSGKAHGLYSLWYENGQLKQIGEYVHGKMNGEWKNFFVDGKVESIENFSAGKRDGIWVYFNSNNDTIKVEYYNKDSLVN